MQKIVTLLVAAATALSVNAAPFKLNKASKVSNQSRTELLQGRGAQKASIKANKTSKKGQKSIRKPNTQIASFRELVKAKEELKFDVLSMNFDFLTEGTPENPVAIEVDDDYNFPESVMGENYGWGGVDLYSAGGCVYLPIDYENELQGYLWTPDIYESGIFTLTIEARSTQPESEFDVYLGVWDDETEDYSYADYTETLITDEWQTYDVVWDATEYSAFSPVYFELDPWGADVMIKSVKISVEKAAIDTPELNDLSDFTGTSFKASWSEVEDADHYLLCVAEVDPEGEIVQPYYIDNQEVKSTEATVDITPGIVYAYWVYAVNAEGGKSFKSTTNIVSKLLDAEGITGTIRSDLSGCDVTWGEVPGANAYLVDSKLYHKAVADETFVIADADFSSIESSGTIEDPVPSDNVYDEFEQMPGWTFWLAAEANGAVGIVDEAIYSWFGVYAQVESGVMDLSGLKDGAVTVKMKAASKAGNGILIGLLTYSEEEETYVVADSKQTEGLSSDFADYEVTLTGGTEQSIIMIMTDSEDLEGDIFFQSIQVSGDLTAGNEIGIPAPSVEAYYETEASIDMACAEGDHFAVTVTPYTLDDDGYVYIEGTPSAPAIIDEISGVESVAANDAEGETRFYNLQGMRVANPATGTIVIRLQGDKATKLLVK